MIERRLSQARNELQQIWDYQYALVNDVLKGGPTPVHQAMIASEEASLSFEFVATMRNKVVDAYNTVMQMQV